MAKSPELDATSGYSLNSSRLIVFVGPSGSGKDTLMVKARDQFLAVDLNCHIVQRWITREPDETEGFQSVTIDEFKKAIERNVFALYWNIYGNYYGVPVSEIDSYLEKGIVLLNLSRAELSKLKQIYPDARIILVEVASDLAEERIRQRRRDQGDMLEARIKRLQENVDLPVVPDLIVKNNVRAINSTLVIVLEFLRASLY